MPGEEQQTPPADAGEPALPEHVPPQQAKAVLSRPVLCIALCLAVVVPLMAARAAYAPAQRGVESGWWRSLQNAVRARASVDLAEDFGDDLGERWAGSDGLPQDWVTNAAGFTRPGQLALYIKSLPLADYHMEFLGLIERKSLNFVYRAMDFNNYYCGRIVIVKPGPVPEAAFERWAVINGRGGLKTQVTLSSTVRMDTLYDVEVEAQGNHFITRINGEFIDSFSDSQLPSGGVGFFSGAGESARICRLRIADHNDTFGRICSLFTTRFEY